MQPPRRELRRRDPGQSSTRSTPRLSGSRNAARRRVPTAATSTLTAARACSRMQCGPQGRSVPVAQTSRPDEATLADVRLWKVSRGWSTTTSTRRGCRTSEIGGATTGVRHTCESNEAAQFPGHRNRAEDASILRRTAATGYGPRPGNAARYGRVSTTPKLIAATGGAPSSSPAPSRFAPIEPGESAERAVGGFQPGSAFCQQKAVRRKLGSARVG